MILLKLFLLSMFVVTWWRARHSLLVEPSDFFVLSFLLIYVPGFLLNPSGQTSLNGLHLPQAAATRAEVALLAMLAIGSLMFMLRRWLELRYATLRVYKVAVSSERMSTLVALAAAVLLVMIFLLLMVSADFRQFKLDVLKFLTFQFEGGDYRSLRNGKYSGGWLLENLIGRLRFTLFPILSCLVLYPLLKTHRAVAAVVVVVVIFLALPASLSKLPIFFFLGYAVVLCATRQPHFLDIRFVAAMLVIVTVMVVTVLIMLYTAQYQRAVLSGAILPLNLAIERIWGETYSVIVRYFSVYPEMLSYTGWSGINMLAKMFGLVPRLPDIEVARTLLGPDSGSNPGIYFLGGYAAFGMAGLCLFAAFGPLVLWMLDLLGRRIRAAPLRATFLAVVGMNGVFLNQIALQTALVTYGLALVPLMLFALDLVLYRIWRGQGGAQGAR